MKGLLRYCCATNIPDKQEVGLTYQRDQQNIVCRISLQQNHRHHRQVRTKKHCHHSYKSTSLLYISELAASKMYKEVVMC